jgi:hypothetical protein
MQRMRTSIIGQSRRQTPAKTKSTPIKHTRKPSVMLVLSQNVRTLTYNKEPELVHLMDKKGALVTFIQSTGRSTDETYALGQHLFICKGGKGPGTGLAFVLSPAAQAAVRACRGTPVMYGDRIMAIRAKVGRTVMVWINIYAPHTGLPTSERELFLDQLSTCLGDCKPNELPVVGGDVNAWLGVGDGKADSMLGPYGIRQSLNTIGKAWAKLLRALGYCAPSTFFKKTPRGRYVNAIGNVVYRTTAHDTFMHTAKKTFFQLDHFIVRHWDRRKRVLNCGAVNYGLESDHRMIMIRLRLTVRTAKARKVVNRDMLRDPETRSNFNALVKDYIRAKAGQPPDGSTQLETLHEAMTAAAKATITIRSRPRPTWFEAAASKLLPIIRVRNACKSNHPQTLKAVRAEIKVKVKDAKEAWVKATVDKIDGTEISPRGRWATMRELQQGSRESIVKRIVEMRLNVDQRIGKASGQGAAAQSRATMVKCLTDNFATLGERDEAVINLVPQREVQNWMNEPPSRGDVTDGIKKLSNGKSGGPSQLPAEFFKAMINDDECMDYVHAVILDFWNSGSGSVPPPNSIPPEPPPSEPSPIYGAELPPAHHAPTTAAQLSVLAGWWLNWC